MTITVHLEDQTGELLIKKGDNVDFDTPLIKKSKNEELKIQIASILKIQPGKIFMHLNKIVGDDVKKGDIVAEKKTILKKRYFISDVDGVIKEINHEDGTITLSAQSDSLDQTLSFFKGKIKEIGGNTVTIEVSDVKSIPLSVARSTFGGEMIFITHDSTSSLNEERVKNKIVCAKSITEYDASRLEVLGVRGIITKHKLPSSVMAASAQIQNPQDFDSLAKEHHPYCIVDKQSTTMFSYR